MTVRHAEYKAYPMLAENHINITFINTNEEGEVGRKKENKASEVIWCISLVQYNQTSKPQIEDRMVTLFM